MAERWLQVGWALLLCGALAAATSAPSGGPSASPSRAPTGGPARPTTGPSSSPTSPSRAPSVPPRAPSRPPTVPPSSPPTLAPTTRPTIRATASPTSRPTGPPKAPTGSPSFPQTIGSYLSTASDLSALKAAVGAAGLDVLSSTGPLTLFAPTDSAWDAIPAGTVDMLLVKPAMLLPILRAHVVPSDDAQEATGTVNTLEVNVTLQLANREAAPTGGASASYSGLATSVSNGAVQRVSAVMVPAGMADFPVLDLPRTAERHGQFDYFARALITAMSSILAAHKHVTCFGPSNRAFEALQKSAVDIAAFYSHPASVAELAGLHCVQRYMTAEQAANSTGALDTLNPRAMLYLRNASDRGSSSSGHSREADALSSAPTVCVAANATTTDIACTDGTDLDIFSQTGILHKIDRVLLPAGFEWPLDCAAWRPPPAGSWEPTWFELECTKDISDEVEKVCVTEIRNTTEGAALVAASSHDSRPWNILVLFVTFAVGALVRFVCIGTRIPFTVVMFSIGMGWGAIGNAYEGYDKVDRYVRLATMDPHLILYIFLPILIFESAFAMEIPVFKKVIVQCLILASGGLMLASGLTGLFANYMFTDYEWTFPACLLFGTILSATDPVAVVALLKELGASQIISTMIEGESLFNDGTAIVFFNVLLGAVQRENCKAQYETCLDQCKCDFECEMPMTPGEIVVEFLRVSLGGPLVGLFIGAVTSFSLNRVFNDPIIEITLTLVAAYVTFFVAEGMFEVSGVLGLVALGCWLSYFRTVISPESEHTLHHFWEMSTFLTNSCVFFLAGMILPLKAFATTTATDAYYLVLTYFVITVVRMLVILVFLPVLYLFEYKLDLGNGLLVGWGGLRGAVGLALALIVEGSNDVVVPQVRDKVIFHTAGIVLLTLLINAPWTPKLVACFKLDAIPLRRRRLMSDRFQQLLHVNKQEIEDLRVEPLNYDCNWEKLTDLTDVSKLLPPEKADPYTDRDDVDEQPQDAGYAEDEGRVAYLNAADSSVHGQFCAGSLAQRSVRKLHRMVHDARELSVDPSSKKYSPSNPSGFLTAEQLRTSFQPGTLEKLNIFDRKKTGWLTRAFNLAVGYIELHKSVQGKIGALCEPAVSHRIVKHCKKTNSETVELLEEMLGEGERRPGRSRGMSAEPQKGGVGKYARMVNVGGLLAPGINVPAVARAVRTKHASRSTLNSMRASLARMAREGRVDAQDSEALTAIVQQRMKGIKRAFPSSMELPTGLEALQLASWYTDLDPATQGVVANAVAQMPDCVRVFPADVEVSFLKQVEQHSRSRGRWTSPGLLVVVTGVVQLRLGRKMYHFGAGFTAGLQSLLTAPEMGCERFSEVFCETRCTMLYLPKDRVNKLMEEAPALSNSLWKACGVQAARILLEGNSGFRHWTAARIRRVAESGGIDCIQDPTHGMQPHEETRKRVPQGSVCILLRGIAWELGASVDIVRFPDMIPAGWRYGTFSHHATLFTIDLNTFSTAATRAQQRWKRLRSKCKSINIWSRLRSPYHARCALAWAFDRPLPDYHGYKPHNIPEAQGAEPAGPQQPPELPRQLQQQPQQQPQQPQQQPRQPQQPQQPQQPRQGGSESTLAELRDMRGEMVETRRLLENMQLRFENESLRRQIGELSPRMSAQAGDLSPQPLRILDRSSVLSPVSVQAVSLPPAGRGVGSPSRLASLRQQTSPPAPSTSPMTPQDVLGVPRAMTALASPTLLPPAGAPPPVAASSRSSRREVLTPVPLFPPPPAGQPAQPREQSDAISAPASRAEKKPKSGAWQVEGSLQWGSGRGMSTRQPRSVQEFMQREVGESDSSYHRI